MLNPAPAKLISIALGARHRNAGIALVRHRKHPKKLDEFIGARKIIDN